MLVYKSIFLEDIPQAICVLWSCDHAISNKLCALLSFKSFLHINAMYLESVPHINVKFLPLHFMLDGISDYLPAKEKQPTNQHRISSLLYSEKKTIAEYFFTTNILLIWFNTSNFDSPALKTRFHSSTLQFPCLNVELLQVSLIYFGKWE